MLGAAENSSHCHGLQQQDSTLDRHNAFKFNVIHKHRENTQEAIEKFYIYNITNYKWNKLSLVHLSKGCIFDRSTMKQYIQEDLKDKLDDI